MKAASLNTPLKDAIERALAAIRAKALNGTLAWLAAKAGVEEMAGKINGAQLSAPHSDYNV